MTNRVSRRFVSGILRDSGRQDVFLDVIHTTRYYVIYDLKAGDDFIVK